MTGSRAARRVVAVGLCVISAALAWRIGMLLFTEHYHSQGLQIDIGPAPWWIFFSGGVALSLLGAVLPIRGTDHAQAAVITPTWRLIGGFALICAVIGVAAAYDNTAPDDSGTVGPDLTLVVLCGLPLFVGFRCYTLLARAAVHRWRGVMAWTSGLSALILSVWMTNVR